MVELDHLFVWVSPGGPEADRLVAFGLNEGPPNTHPGQGTACRRFFFRNAYLEVLWACDEAELQSEAIRLTGLWERCSGRASGASPFGLAVRSVRPGGEAPFPCWDYRPPYMPPGQAIPVAQGVPECEPWWFYIRGGQRPDDPGRPKPMPLEHSVGFREITRIRFTGPGLGSPSEAARAVLAACPVTLTEGTEHLAEITFDGGGQGQGADFRPSLPLVFRW
jgi:hypothetical protein